MQQRILKNKIPLLFWIALHIGVAILFLVFPHGTIETDLISIVPKISQDRSFEKPLKHFFSLSSNTINLFVESEHFDTAKEAAYQLEHKIRELSNQVRVQLEVGGGDYNTLLEFFDKHKYALLSDNIAQQLSYGGAAELTEEAVANVYSPFFISPFTNVETDPFLLVNGKVEDLLEALTVNLPTLQMQDNLLYTSVDGKNNIFMTIDLPVEFSSADGRFQFMRQFLNYVDELSRSSGVSIYYSGVPVHSFYSQKSAQLQISIISTISIIATFFLFLFTYKSIAIFIVCMGTLALSTGLAYCITSILFPSIHIFSFVFGTSVIGVTMDYSIHYITHWYFENGAKDVVKKIFASLFLGLLTTVISYVALSFSSIALLRQLSVFSIVGVTGSFLTVVIVFPLIFKNPPKKNNNRVLTLSETYLRSYSSVFANQRRILSFAVAILICISVWGVTKIRTDFSAAGLYSIPDNLIVQEIAVNERMGNMSNTDLIIVKADSVDALAEKEELLAPLLKDEQYLALSKFLPSIKKQRENILLVKKELLPLLEQQAEALALDRQTFLNIRKDIEQSEEHLVGIEQLAQFSALSSLQKLILQNDGSYFSVIILQKGVNAQTKSSIEAAEFGIKVFSVLPAINAALNKTAYEAMLFNIGAYVLIFFVIFMFLYKKQALVIIAIQMFCLLLNLGIHGLFGIPVNIFSILALILSLGISMDFFIFFSHNAEIKGITFIAVFLSMLTTILSFGTLSFSSFIPVRSFALSLFIGIVCAFVFAPIVMLFGRDKQKSVLQ
ncbi:transporter [Treponema medium]|uniref:MMPL family transporter n=1 Tax=Treponema medium TaxID=58231 RepID=UPI00197F2BCD|nr:transporter [Treponema medium]QSH91735.1 transporter [Treponema medium]